MLTFSSKNRVFVGLLAALVVLSAVVVGIFQIRSGYYSRQSSLIQTGLSELVKAQSSQEEIRAFLGKQRFNISISDEEYDSWAVEYEEPSFVYGIYATRTTFTIYFDLNRAKHMEIKENITGS